MSKALVLAAVLIAVTGAIWAACPASPKCPVHDYEMHDVGQVKFENGHRFELYRCPAGDEYWLRCD